MTAWMRTAADLARRNVAFLVVFAMHIVLKAILGARALDVPLSGDELAYVDAAKSLSNAARDMLFLGPFDVPEIRDNVVANGWFMPGMSIILAPLYLVAPAATPGAMRLFIGVLTTGVLLVAALVLQRTLGRAYALGILVFPGLVPMWILFSFTAWGDLTAGLLVVVIVAFVIGAGQRLIQGQGLRWWHGASFGGLAAACLYVRSSMLPLTLGMIVFLGVAVLYLLRGPARRVERTRSLGAVLAAAVTFIGLLLPWSIAASAAFDRPVVTTTTLPLSLAIAFGNQDRICFGPCQAKNPWTGSVRYARGVSQTIGTNELVVQEQMSEYALSDLTYRHYAATVLDNLRRYLLEPASFEPRFRQRGARPDEVSNWIVESTRMAYMATLLIATGALLVVSTSRTRPQLTSIVIKLTAAALLVQPFVHPSHGRYWPGFAPLLGISAVHLTQSWSGRLYPSGVDRELKPSITPESRALTFVQISIVTVFFFVLSAFLTLSR